MLNCICCQKPLTGGLDTFGQVGAEMCWPCWSSIGFEWSDTFETGLTCPRCGEEMMTRDPDDTRLDHLFCVHCGYKVEAGTKEYEWFWFS